MIRLGAAARALRDELGLSVRAAADELKMSFTHLTSIENGRATPSPEIISRFRSAWNIDLYMYAVCNFSDNEDFPAALRASVMSMKNAWDKQIKDEIRRRNKGLSRPCLESKR